MSAAHDLLWLAELLERGADTLAMFVYHARVGSRMLEETRLAASRLARDLAPQERQVLTIDGRDVDVHHLRQSAAASLLHFVSLARGGRLPLIADTRAAAQLARELSAAADEIRIEAARLQ